MLPNFLMWTSTPYQTAGPRLPSHLGLLNFAGSSRGLSALLKYNPQMPLRRRSRLGAELIAVRVSCTSCFPVSARSASRVTAMSCKSDQLQLKVSVLLHSRCPDDRGGHTLRQSHPPNALACPSSSHSGQREGEARPPRLGPVPSRHQPRLRTSPEADSDRTRIHRPSRDTAPRAQDRHQGQEHVPEAVTCVGPAGPAPIR